MISRFRSKRLSYINNIYLILDIFYFEWVWKSQLGQLLRFQKPNEGAVTGYYQAIDIYNKLLMLSSLRLKTIGTNRERV